MNQVTFVGRIVNEIELKQAGKSVVVNNSIAVPRPYTDENGEQKADFIPFVAWNKLADVFAKYTAKGQQVALGGRMQSRNYINDKGQRVYVVECIVDTITLLAGQGRPQEKFSQEAQPTPSLQSNDQEDSPTSYGTSQAPDISPEELEEIAKIQS